MDKINIFGYLIFAFTTAITPGPNNILLFSSGKNFGIRNSFSIMAGIFSGFFILLYIAGYGVGELITRSHVVSLILKILSSIWLLYLAYAIRNISIDSSLSAPIKKVGYWEALLMQFINLKAWFMAINGAAAFLPKFQNIHMNVLIFTMIFTISGIPCMIIWVKFGEVLSRFLKSERAHLITGHTLSLLLIISIITIWI